MHPSIHSTAAFECPSLDLLIDFDLGKLPEPESLSFAEHISECDRCEQVLHDLHGQATDDSVVLWLKRCLAAPSWDEPPPLQIEQLAETIHASYFVRANLVEEEGYRAPDRLSPERLTSIGKYELSAEIGHGGMGVVYRGKHRVLGKVVAIKMISAGRHASPKSIARFAREGKAIARLDHPNVVEIYDFDQHEGLPYFAMELMEGGSLQATLAAGPLAPKAAAELVRTLARAVHYMHEKGIVHRDLKPANILLGLDGTPKISDFGLAKLLDPDPDGPESPNLTDSGTLLGTIGYTAPEQLFPKKPGDPGRSIDIHALGAILYESLTGRPPFSAPTRLEVLDKVRTKPPVPPSWVLPDVPPWLEEVCLKCLEKSPSLRHPTAEALAVDLDRWLADERPRPTIRRAGRAWRRFRRPGAVALACVTPILLLAMGLSRNDPDISLKRIQADLARGQAVSLVGQTGLPKWYRWNSGQALAKLAQGTDGATSIQSWETTLVELTPDPRSDHYKISAQIRHDLSETAGEVGLYFAHTTFPVKPHLAQFFLQVAFNSVRGDADLRARIPIALKPTKAPRLNAVSLRPRLISPGPTRMNFDMSLSPVMGPKFKSLGQNNGTWHDLEVVVTPTDLVVRWDGETFAAPVADLQARVDGDLSPDHPLIKGLSTEAIRPRIDLKGSIGIYLRGSSASFRSVKIEPL